MKIKFKKGHSYPNFWTSLKVMFCTVLNNIHNNGVVKSRVKISIDSMYEFDDSDQSDVLKLFGFKSIKQIYHKKLGYSTSNTEDIMGFRRRSKGDFHFEFGFHQRRGGDRLPFKAHIVEIGKWTRLPDLTSVKWHHLPIPPYFGGADSNGDGIGGKAPSDVTIELEFIW